MHTRVAYGIQGAVIFSIFGLLFLLADKAIAAETPSPAVNSIQTLCVEEEKARIRQNQEKIWAISPNESDVAKLKKREEDLQKLLNEVEYEICNSWVRTFFKAPDLADQIIVLRESVGHQKKVAKESFRRGYRWLQVHQWGIVFLGLVATLLSAWATRAIPGESAEEPGPADHARRFSFYALFVTSLITALGTITGFYDLRGTAERNAKVWGAMGELQSLIDDRLMQDAAGTDQNGTTKFIL